MKSKAKQPSAPRQINTPAAPQTYKERNLAAINPTKEQFEPTDAAPIPQHKRMAGGG